MIETALFVKKKIDYLIWLIPVVAIIVSMWMTYKYFSEVGSEISIVMKDGTGIEAGRTELRYKGIKIGLVTDLNITTGDISTVDVIVTVDSDAFQAVAREGSKFWKVSPKVNLTEISGLDTVMGGVYIDIQPSGRNRDEILSQPVQTKFVAEEKKPAEVMPSGYYLTLVSKDGSITEGTPIFYRKLSIGKIVDKNLTKDGVNYQVVIDKPYKHLVKNSSRFWLDASVKASATLSQGLTVEIGSLSSLVIGGISMSSPEEDQQKISQTMYTLYDSEARAFTDEKSLITLMSDSHEGLSEGTPLLYKGMKIGEIITSRYVSKAKKFEFSVKVDQPYLSYLNRKSLFYKNAGIDVEFRWPALRLKTQSLSELVSGGITVINLSTKPNKTSPKTNFHLMSHESYKNLYHFPVTIDLGHAKGLVKGTSIMYNGVQIGQLSNLEIKGDRVIGRLLVEKRHKQLFVKDTYIWKQSFQAGLKEVKNPENFISGASLHILPGTSATHANYFQLREQAPRPSFGKKGLHFTLEGDRASSLQPGSPVYYKQVKIGFVDHITLKKSASHVLLTIFVPDCAAQLVRNNSVFYMAGAFGMQLSLSGLKVSTETFETMMRGGISMVIPEKPESPAKNAKVFKIHNKPDEDWFDWKSHIKNGFHCSKAIL